MSDEDLESTETVEEVDDVTTDDSTEDESSEVKGDTNDAIRTPLEGVNDVDVLKGMVTRLRHENGNHRKEKQSLKSENETLKQWRINHNKGVAEAKARADKAEQVAKQYIIKAAAVEYDVDDDLIDLIDGATEEEIWAKAEKLHNTKKRKPAYETPTPTNVDLFAGRSRGRPVAPAKNDAAGAEFLRDLMGR